jgi:hypothetical protein
MPERSTRFAINDGLGHRGATWKCFAPIGSGKDDVYLACRELGAIKASLHHSGQCHLAYAPTFFEAEVVGADHMPQGRFIEKWPRPKEIASGLTLALRISTPWSAVNVPYSQAAFPAMKWIPNAPTGKATEIDILLSTAATKIAGWPGRDSMGTQLIDSVQLDSGAMAWIVHWVIPMPNLGSGQINAALQFFRGEVGTTQRTRR